MNSLKCSDCKYYDAIKSGRSKVAVHGWCSVKSVYPFKEGPGQVFPPGVRRVESGELPAKPEIVEGAKVVKTCTQAVKR